MEADDIVFWFSIIVSVLVALGAFLVIRTYNNIGKK